MICKATLIHQCTKAKTLLDNKCLNMSIHYLKSTAYIKIQNNRLLQIQKNDVTPQSLKTKLLGTGIPQPDFNYGINRV